MPKASQLTADERLALILESFRQEHSIAELCRKTGSLKRPSTSGAISSWRVENAP